MARTIDKYLADPKVSDIYLEAWDQGWIVKDGVEESVKLFKSPESLTIWLTQQLKRQDKAITPHNPVENCILKDGSRLFAFAPPVASSLGLAIRTHH